MSDNEEMMQTKNSSLEDSSGDESSSEAAVHKEFSSRDGEPVNKPRKESTSSTSSSSSSEDEGPRAIDQDDSEEEEESSKSEVAVSKSEAVTESSEFEAGQPQKQPDPQPRSRSVSVEEGPAPASRKKSVASSIAENDDNAAADTDDEVEDIGEAVVGHVSGGQPAQPVPVERKVSIPPQPEIIVDEHEHHDEEPVVEKQTEEVITRKSSSASDSDSEPEVQEEEQVASVEAKPATIIDSDSASGSSSEDEIVKPPTSQSPNELNGRRSNNGIDVTKIYTNAVQDNNNKSINNNNNIEKQQGNEPRTKPTKDITQIYTQTIAKASPPASPRSMPRGRPASDITKLYTGKLETSGKAAESADKPGPRKHNMSTAVDKDAIRRAYDDVRSDTSETEWAVFKFDEGNRLGVTATGKEFADFKNHFENDDRGFGYIRIKTGDEMSKRAKFVLVTWVGQNVSVMKKAKMSTDKALMKDIIQNMSVELQLENHGEFSADHFKMQVDKASGARYGTGVRDL